MQSQCRIRSRESGMWGVGVGRWRLAESKRTEEKSEHSWEGRRHQVRRLAVHLCAFMLCTHTLRPKLECMLLSARKKIMEKQ